MKVTITQSRHIWDKRQEITTTHCNNLIKDAKNRVLQHTDTTAAVSEGMQCNSASVLEPGQEAARQLFGHEAQAISFMLGKITRLMT